MNICVIIPCRFNSTRFPGKPLEDLNGKPMLYYPYTEALKAKSVSKAFIATDDDRIVDVCNKFRFNVIKTIGNHATGSDRVAEAYHLISKSENYDLIINVQGDEPFINKQHIEDCILAIQNNPDADAANGVSIIRNQNDLLSHSTVKATISKNKKLLFLTRSNVPYPNIRTQQITYYKQLGLYAFKPKALSVFNDNHPSNLEQAEAVEILRLLENDTYVTTFAVEILGPSVDTYNDLLTARNLLSNKPE